MPFNRAGSVRQNSASQSLYARKMGHQQRVRHLEVKEPLRGIEDFAGHPIELHVLEVLFGVVPPAVHVFEAPLGGDRPGFRDNARPGAAAEPQLRRLQNDFRLVTGA
jgi:hypothetical protein